MELRDYCMMIADNMLHNNCIHNSTHKVIECKECIASVLEEEILEATDIKNV